MPPSEELPELLPEELLEGGGASLELLEEEEEELGEVEELEGLEELEELELWEEELDEAASLSFISF